MKKKTNKKEKENKNMWFRGKNAPCAPGKIPPRASGKNPPCAPGKNPPCASGVMCPGGHTHFRCHAHFRTSDAMPISDDVQKGGHLR